MEVWLKVDFNDHLRYPVRHGRHSKNTLSFVLLGYFYCFDWRGRVAAEDIRFQIFVVGYS
ncbi:MAG: hypothetical protein QHH02_06755 [Syntrophomonadaceae bacterium]|nr:hypothetical protein [Syntrophomonadaceae bacterium]